MPLAAAMVCWCSNAAGTFADPALNCTQGACPFPARCVDKVTGVPQNGTKCVDGTEDRLGSAGCALCKAQWYRTNNDDCRPCPQNSASTIAALVFFGVFVLYIGPKVSGLFSATTRTVVKQVLSHLSLFSINLNLGLHWPHEFRVIFSRLRALVDGIQLAAPECLSASWSYDTYLIMLFCLYAGLGIMFAGMHALSLQLQRHIRLNGIEKMPTVDRSPLRQKLAKLMWPVGWVLTRTSYATRTLCFILRPFKLDWHTLYDREFILQNKLHAGDNDGHAADEPANTEEAQVLKENSVVRVAVTHAIAVHNSLWETLLGIKHFALLLTSVSFLYLINVSSKSLDCIPDASNTLRMRTDLTVDCTTSTHIAIQRLSLAVIAGVGAGLPILYALAITVVRERAIQTPLQAKELVSQKWTGLRDPGALWGQAQSDLM